MGGEGEGLSWVACGGKVAQCRMVAGSSASQTEILLAEGRIPF